MLKCDSERARQFLSVDHYRIEDEEFVAHLDQCEECRQYLENRAANDDLWDTAGKMLQPGEFDRAGVEAYSAATVIGRTGQHPVAVQDVLAALAPTDDPHKLGRIGSYEVTGVVGVGGMGVVMKAVDPSLERVVALKVMSPALANNEKARKRFAREARAAAAVLHPNVVPIHSVSSDGSMPYLVMAYVRGGSLQKRLETDGPLPTVEILRIGSQIAAGLAAAHEQGLVHRDIKPENVLLEEGVERVTITDFGLARAVDDTSVTRQGTIAGTPEYMSPEQARGESVDQSSDLFSLGSVLYALCTGRPPYRGDTSYGVMRKIIDEDPAPIHEINPQIPGWLAGIVQKLMAKDKADRFASAAEVHTLMDACISHVQQPDSIALPRSIAESGTWNQPPAPAPRSFIRSPAVIIPGLLLVLALLLPVLSQVGDDGDEGNDGAAAAANAGRDKEPSMKQMQIERLISDWKDLSSETTGRESRADRLSEVRTALAPQGRENTERRRKSTAQTAADVWPFLDRSLPQPIAAMFADITKPGAGVRISDKLAKAGQPTEPLSWDVQTTYALALARSGRIPEALTEIESLLLKINTNLQKGRLSDLKLTYFGEKRSQKSVLQQALITRSAIQGLAGDIVASVRTSAEAGAVEVNQPTDADVPAIQSVLAMVARINAAAAEPGRIDKSSAHAANDHTAILGNWRVAFVEDGGRAGPPDAVRDIRFVITKNMLTMEIGERRSESMYTLDPSTNPKSIDLTEDGRTKPGIYDLQGDTLRICLSEATSERPTAFDSQPDSVNDLVFLLKRVVADERADIDSVQAGHDGPLTAELARELIPEAAAISNADFQKLQTAPSIETVDNKSLSLILMALHVSDERPHLANDFRFLVDGPLKPSDLAAAMALSRSKGYVSMIQPAYISDCRVWSSTDQRARGYVAFNAPLLYTGEAIFEAGRHQGMWRIEKFRLQSRQISVILGDDGKWRREKRKQVPGAAVAFEILTEVASGVRFSSDSRLLAETNQRGLRVWTVDGRLLREIKTNGPAWAPAFDPQSVLVFAAEAHPHPDDPKRRRSTIRSWNIASGRESTLGEIDGVVRDLQLSADGGRLAAVSYDEGRTDTATIEGRKPRNRACLSIWDVKDAKRLAEVDFRDVEKKAFGWEQSDEFYEHHNLAVPTHLRFSPDGRRLVTSFRNNPFVVVDGRTGDVERVLQGAGGVVEFAANGNIVSANDTLDESFPLDQRAAARWRAKAGDFAIVLLNSGQVKIEALKSPRYQQVLPQPDTPQPLLDISANGRFVVVGENAGVTIWQLDDKGQFLMADETSEDDMVELLLSDLNALSQTLSAVEDGVTAHKAQMKVQELSARIQQHLEFLSEDSEKPVATLAPSVDQSQRINAAFQELALQSQRLQSIDDEKVLKLTSGTLVKVLQSLAEFGESNNGK